MNRSLTAILLATTVAACHTAWSSVDDCKALRPGGRADDCWAKFAPDVFRTDAKAGIDIVEHRIRDPRVKDFVWLTVTREVDPSSYKYCDRIQDKALADRCRVLVSRPHLHRALMKAKRGRAGPTPRAPSGAPPPNGTRAPSGGTPPPVAPGG